MFAIIQNNAVTDTLRVDPATIYPPAYANQFVPVPDGVERGWLLVAGEFVAPPAPAPTIPQSVTRRQAKQALALAGLLGNVQPALDAIPNATQRAMMQIEWDDSQDFERQRPSLIAIGGALGLDSAALDQLFVTAAAL